MSFRLPEPVLELLARDRVAQTSTNSGLVMIPPGEPRVSAGFRRDSIETVDLLRPSLSLAYGK